MTVLLLLRVLCAGISATMVASRIGYALVRDGAFPHSEYFRKVHPKLQVTSAVNSTRPLPEA